MISKDLGLLILRIGFGAMMLFGHGWGKLANFSAIAPNFPDPLGAGGEVSLALAIFAEVFCAIAIILGAFTRYAAFPLAMTMIVAVVFVHGNDPWAKKEFALLYAVPFICLFFSGGGKFSLDTLLLKRT